MSNDNGHPPMPQIARPKAQFIITLMDDGGFSIQGGAPDHVTALGLFEMAKHAYTRQMDRQADSGIVIPRV